MMGAQHRLAPPAPDAPLTHKLKYWGHRRLGMNYPSEETMVRALLRAAAARIEALEEPPSPDKTQEDGK